jgi:hypothetical protein
MKKILLLTTLLFVFLTAGAQTYNNPSQKSNDDRVKITKVERTSDATIVYLKYTSNSANTWSCIDAYPYLIDEATGKKYQATDALNFKWGVKYKGGNSTFKIEFPPLPKKTTAVTYREAGQDKNVWIIKSISLQQKQSSQTGSQKSSNGSSTTSNGSSTTYNNPRQTTNNKYIKVVRVVRSKEYTIVHFTYNLGDFNDLKISAGRMELVDDDTETVYKAVKALNFENGKAYQGTKTFKVQFQPLPRSVSVVRFRETSNSNSYLEWSVKIQLPPAASRPKSNNNSKTVNINVY